jgi:hypothetical protein
LGVSVSPAPDQPETRGITEGASAEQRLAWYDKRFQGFANFAVFTIGIGATVYLAMNADPTVASAAFMPISTMVIVVAGGTSAVDFIKQKKGG